MIGRKWNTNRPRKVIEELTAGLDERLSNLERRVENLERLNELTICTYETNPELMTVAKKLGWIAPHATALTKLDAANVTVLPRGTEISTGVYHSEFEELKTFNELEFFDVTEIWPHTFDGCTQLTAITLPGVLTTIEDYAFNNCSSLSKISLPDRVSFVGKGVFRDCLMLHDVALSNKMESIPDGMFEACHSLRSLVLPSSVKSIGEYSFLYCVELQSMNTNNVSFFGEGAFSQCFSLKSVVIPARIDDIMLDVFINCSELQNVRFYGGIDNFNGETFADCPKLTYIYINQETPPIMWGGIFVRTPLLQHIYVPEGSGDAYRNNTHWKIYSDLITEIMEAD